MPFSNKRSFKAQVRSWSSDHGAAKGASRLSDGGDTGKSDDRAQTPSPVVPPLRIDPATPNVSETVRNSCHRRNELVGLLQTAGYRARALPSGKLSLSAVPDIWRPESKGCFTDLGIHPAATDNNPGETQMPTPPSGAPSPVRGNRSDANGDSQHDLGPAAAAQAPAVSRPKSGALQAQLAGTQAAPAEVPAGRPAEFAETPFSVLSPSLQV